jgi:hypothetical protein
MTTLHARPHLQTHNRAQGHSAVKGAAYRLGLKLYDRRADVWADFTRRKRGEEIVLARTIAPAGAPDWATDPDELWNRVELSERRKDSQLARDYRLPIPLGLSDQAAGDLAMELAQFICDELTVPVSMGLHRDGDINAFGELKPAHQQGFHAHIYFPTRPILLDDGTAGKAERGASGNDDALAEGFGPKISALSNRRTSAAVVDRLNRRWAELANKYAVEADLTPDYDHRSYERAGLPHVPRPMLSRGAVAMERKGWFTEQGDKARQIIVASQVFEKAHAAALETQHARAVADSQRNAVPEIFPSPFEGLEYEPAPEDDRDNPEPVGSHFGVASPSPVPDEAEEPSPLVERFEALADRPTDPELLTLRVQVKRLVRAIERALNALRGIVERIKDHAEAIQRRRVAKASADLELTEHRHHRASARERLAGWEAAHPWRIRATQRFGLTPGARSRTWQTLLHDVKRDERFVNDAKVVVKLHDLELDHFAAEQHQLENQEHAARGRLSEAVGQLDGVSSSAMAPLLAAVGEEEQTWIRAVLPPEPVMAAAAPEVATAAVGPRHRPKRTGPGR